MLLTTSAVIADEQALLKVFLPRCVSISNDIILLGDAAILTGSKDLVETASAVTLGRTSIGTGDVQLDRNAILSRLASVGIYYAKIEFSGAPVVSIKRQSLKITGEQILKCAYKAITENGLASACSWKAVTTPKDIFVSAEANQVTIHPAIENASTTSLRMRIAVYKGQKEINAQVVQFQAQYQAKRAIALKDIPAGGLLSADNIKIETYHSAYPQANWVEPFGLIAKRTIRTNSVIGGEMAANQNEQIVINRSQGVVIQIKRPGLSITAMGEAMQDGRTNEYIKVRNIDSQKVLVARVNHDGTVEPVF